MSDTADFIAVMVVFLFGCGIGCAVGIILGIFGESLFWLSVITGFIVLCTIGFGASAY